MSQAKRIAAAQILCAICAAAAAPEARFRVAAIDSAAFPRVRVVLDQRKQAAGAPAINASDFRLLEDGKAGANADRALKFRDTELPLALIVAIDASQSMKGRPLAAIRQGIAQLVGRKRKNDRVAILSFADDIRFDARWDASEKDLRAAFQGVEARGNRTRLYDAVEQAINSLETEASGSADFPLRRGILVLSDGHDEGSGATLPQIVQRLAASRIRLDAIGLARSPLWLQSLESLAHAGFGEFRTASAPEGLTHLLEQGIDLLLDTTVLEFQASRGLADGKAHPLGVEHVPAHWRDQMTITIPETSAWTNPMVWGAGGAAGIAGSAALVIWKRKRSHPPPAAAAAPAVSVPASSSVNRRGETVAEPDPQRVRAAVVTRRATEVQPEVPLEMPRPPESRPRAATLLAPQEAPPASALMCVSGPYTGQRFSLTAEEFWIGSAANNHLLLSADPAVSGNHACIRRDRGFLRVYDNQSLNNTWVNSRSIAGDAVLLQPGDRIRIGQSEFTVTV